MEKRQPDGAFGDFHEPLCHNDSLQAELRQWEQASDEDLAKMESDNITARIATLEAENARLHKFKNEAARILNSLASGVIRVMEEQLDQSRKVAAQMAKEIEDFTQEPPNAK